MSVDGGIGKPDMDESVEYLISACMVLPGHSIELYESMTPRLFKTACCLVGAGIMIEVGQRDVRGGNEYTTFRLTEAGLAR